MKNRKVLTNIYIAKIAEIDETDVGLRYIIHAGNKYTWLKKI